MKKYINLFIFILSLVSCIPPGKLTEALEANSTLNRRYDSLQIKLSDTVANYSNSISSLKNSLYNLKDSVSYYRGLVAAIPAASQEDLFLNQILSYSLLSKSELASIQTANSSKVVDNAWLEKFKIDLEKYSVANVEIKLNNGYVFVDIPSNIMFASGSATLNNKSIKMLGGIAHLLEVQPDLSFMIEGHTDNKSFQGDNNDNWTLSVNRAAAVAKILQTKYKVDPKRMIAAGRSEYMPLDNNYTKLGRLNNRRIRIILMPSINQIMNLTN